MRKSSLFMFLVVLPAFANPNIYYKTTPITLHITNVRSIAPERRIGFSRTDEVFAVDAYSTVTVGSWVSGPQTEYVLYCVKAAPESGKAYGSRDEYIDGNYSTLKLWPVEKSFIGAGNHGRLYRVVQIHDVLDGKHPDLLCDVYSAKDLK